MLISREVILANSERLPEGLGARKRPSSPQAMQTADKAVRGIITFGHLGSYDTQVGRSDIDWSGPQHNHQEWRAQLNRFFALPNLASAYAETGDEQYARAARDYLTEWLRAHPAREGWTIAPYDNTLNLAIRTQQWLVSLPQFLSSPCFEDALVDDIVRSICAQYDYLSRNLTLYANWRIAQADSLLSNGLRLEGLPQAAAWRALGVRVLNDAYHRQVLPDGAHIERNPGYHTWMTHVFATCWRLGRAMPQLGLIMEPEAVARMYDYAVAVRKPNGSCNDMHDSHGTRTGSAASDALASRAAFRKQAGLPEAMPPTSQFFPHAGQALMRDGWGEDASYVTFDATTWGGGHCHLSRNAVQLHAHGRSLVCDPSYFTYEPTDPMMAYGRSTRAHSTVNLNGWNQSQADPECRFASAPGYDLVESTYDGGYWPTSHTWQWDGPLSGGVGAEHYRAVLWIHGRCLVVIDQVACPRAEEMQTSLESNWQLCEGEVKVDSDGSRAVTWNADANVLLLFPLRPDGMQLTVHEGEKEPLCGWLPGRGEYLPAPLLSQTLPALSTRGVDIATVLVPFKGATAPQVTAEAQGTQPGGVARLVLRWGDGSTDELYWTGRMKLMIGKVDELETDAGLVHLQRDAARSLVRGLVAYGTHIEPWAPRARTRPEVFALTP